MEEAKEEEEGKLEKTKDEYEEGKWWRGSWS